MRSPPHPARFGLYITLSLADLVLTCILLTRAGDVVGEANPFANWWLRQFGWVGFAVFKGSLVGAVLGLVAAIAWLRPLLAVRLLDFACLSVGSVVLYSLCLLPAVLPSMEDQQAAQLSAELEEWNQEQKRDVRQNAAYWALFTRLTDAVVTGEYSLDEAAELLLLTPRLQDPIRLRNLGARDPGRPPRELLALVLIRRVKAQSAAVWESAGRKHIARLLRDFQQIYGAPIPDDLADVVE